ncbi:MAG: hypothetical protein KKA73_19695 [Chloroflexi bacterium]|nr:hypothetical protein [Chloroflexota bacterium]MBU1749912.1 hypothetical protein [Chloroflexota bacterium]
MARRATAIKQLRQDNAAVLFVDAGNALTGQDLADKTKGLAVVDAMNLMDYDALALGERELALSVNDLRAAMAQAQFKVLSANVVLLNTDTLFTEPYAVIQVGDRRVGVLGLTGIQAQNPALFATDPLAAAQKYVPQLAQETDLVVVLSNAGTATDQQIAAQVPGVDVIVSSGSMLDPEQQKLDSPSKTLMVQSGYQGRWLGILRLRLDSTNTISQWFVEAWKLLRTFADDPDMTALLQRYRAQYPLPTPTPLPSPPATLVVPSPAATQPVPAPTVEPASYPSPSPGT